MVQPPQAVRLSRSGSPYRPRTNCSGGKTLALSQRSALATLRDPYHQPHLQNFFDAVRGKATLNCPAEEAYKTAVAVLRVNDAIEAKTPVAFTPGDFKV